VEPRKEEEEEEEEESSNLPVFIQLLHSIFLRFLGKLSSGATNPGISALKTVTLEQ
jgi:hypothetical protein